MNRNALIIGNSNYLDFREIKSCINDADAMADDFNSLRFNRVICEKNIGVLRMQKTIDDFANNYECDSLNVIYFSGHGFNFNGNDYIMAIDTKESNPESTSISVKSIIEKYSGMHAYVILIIDACRSFEGNIQDFCSMNMQKDVMIAYSTQIGQESYGAGRNNLSPFTKAIHSNILKTNLSINSLFQMVRQQLSNNRFVQMSCEVSTMTQDIPLTYSFVDYNDEQIYEFVQNDHNGSFLEATLKASELYNRSYLDIMYSYDKVSCRNLFEYGCPEYFTEDECKCLDFEKLTKLSEVKYKNYRFYYKNKEIRIGEIPLLSKFLEYQEPITPLKVRIRVNAERDVGRIKIKFDSNLPIGFVLLVSFPLKLTYSRSVPITDNTFIIVDENDVDITNNKFVIDISSVAILENSSLISIVGKQGRNLTGQYVSFSDIWGNQIQFHKEIKLE